MARNSHMNALKTMGKSKPIAAKTVTAPKHHGKNLGKFLHPKKAGRRG